jgi:uncharacterized protein YcaQ
MGTDTEEEAALRLSVQEARALMLAAQGLLDAPPRRPGLEDIRATIDRLGVVQVDTISVIERSQYLVLWSRLGAYDPALLDALLYPRRRVFEYWSHAASIVPMEDYPYYRRDMLWAWQDHMWVSQQRWRDGSDGVLRQTLETIRERGPMASADFERDPQAERTGPWDWYGPKESRRALDVLWTTGELMVHSRRAGQKVYDLRERVLAEAFGEQMPGDDALPEPRELLRHFVDRTIRALGVVTPSWLWDYFRLSYYYEHAFLEGTKGTRRTAARAMLDGLVREGAVVPAAIDGLDEPAYVATERLADLERLRQGERPTRTTLLSPFDSLIWDRKRARALFGYEVSFEAYVVPEKRRFGYYCLAILHRGALVGRCDLKIERATKRLVAKAVYLEPGVKVRASLVGGLAGALRELGRFLRAETIVVERGEPETLAFALRERLG